MQGQLRSETLSFTIETTCGQSGRPIQIEMNGDLRYRVADDHADLLIFVPMVNFGTLEDPSILDAF